MRFFLAITLWCMSSLYSRAQVGVTVAPYLFSTAFMSQIYYSSNDYGINAFGFDATVNVKNRFYAGFSMFRIMGEHKRTFTDNAGGGPPTGASHQNFRWAEAHIDYAVIAKPWKEMDKWAPALALRAGILFNSRMTMVAPQVGMDSTYVQYPPFIVDSLVPLNRFDLTGVKQTMFTGGISIKIMRKKKVDMSRGFVYFKNLSTGVISAYSVGTEKGSVYHRVRQWDFYADYIYAPKSVYNDYFGWDDRQMGTRTIKGSEIPGLENAGWRVGVKHVAFNQLGLQWVIEYMQLPGQKIMEGIEDLDEPTKKNRFLIIGLNMSIGFNAGGR